jgi:hypothetical protein
MRDIDTGTLDPFALLTGAVAVSSTEIRLENGHSMSLVEFSILTNFVHNPHNKPITDELFSDPSLALLHATEYSKIIRGWIKYDLNLPNEDPRKIRSQIK